MGVNEVAQEEAVGQKAQTSNEGVLKEETDLYCRGG